jgi:hypothetical protein
MTTLIIYLFERRRMWCCFSGSRGRGERWLLVRVLPMAMAAMGLLGWFKVKG